MTFRSSGLLGADEIEERMSTLLSHGFNGPDATVGALEAATPDIERLVNLIRGSRLVMTRLLRIYDLVEMWFSPALLYRASGSESESEPESDEEEKILVE